MEEMICSAEEVLKSERKNRKAQGAFSDMPAYMIPYTQIRKSAVIKTISGACREGKKQV